MRSAWAIVGLGMLGCGASVKEVPGRPYVGATELGDANGDGGVDIADAIFVHDHLFRGGAAPPCTAAANFAPNDLIEMGDGYAVLGFLFLGYSEHPALDTSLCAGATALPAPEPARVGFEIVPPERGETAATIVLHAPETPVQGWSLGVRASSCRINAATTLGTAAADTFDGGVRDTGFDRTNTVEGGAVSAVELSWKKDITVGGDKEPVPVLKLELQGTSSCDCTLTVTGDLAGADRPVELVVAAGGRSYRPEGVERAFRYCGS